jgi:hypothetical protein
MNVNPSHITHLVTVKQNDTARLLYDDLKINGTPINLVSSSVVLVWHDPRNNITERKDATVQVAPSGSVSYQLTEADLEATGSHLMEWEVIRADGTKLSVPTEGYFKLNILGDLD